MTETIPDAVLEKMAEVAIESLDFDEPVTKADMARALKAAEAAGYVLVPIQPTKEMSADGTTAVDNAIDTSRDSYESYVIEQPDRWAYAAWEAMIAARPKVP